MLDVNPVKQENISKVDVYYDILFDKAFAGGTSTSEINEQVIGRIHKNKLINVTYGKGELFFETTKGLIKLISNLINLLNLTEMQLIGLKSLRFAYSLGKKSSPFLSY